MNILLIFPESNPLLISSHTIQQISLEIDSSVFQVTETTYFSVSVFTGIITEANINWPFTMGLVLTCFTCFTSFNTTILWEISTIIIPMLKMSKPDTQRLNHLPKIVQQADAGFYITIWLQIPLSLLIWLFYISHPEHFISYFSPNKAGTVYQSFCIIFQLLMGIRSTSCFKFQEAFYDPIILGNSIR